MSRASEFLTLMADGRQYTNTDLCRITGLSKRQVDSVIGQLRNAGRLETLPVMHAITGRGLKALEGGRIHAVRKPRAVPEVAESACTLERAIASRAALQLAWRAA